MPSCQRILRNVLSAAVILIGLSFGASTAAAGTNAEELQRKIADIGLLKQQLEDRRQQAESVLASLLEEQKSLMAEVHLLRRSMNVTSYKQAVRHHRLRYNIELLRSIDAYTLEFSTKIRLYKTGRDKLSYLRQLAEDDIRMINTLSDFQIDALATQISLVINKYLHEAHVIQIDPEKVNPDPPEKVWNRIVSGTF